MQGCMPRPVGQEKGLPRPEKGGFATPRPVKITKTYGAKLISIHWNSEGNYKEGSKLNSGNQLIYALFYPRPAPPCSQKSPPRASLIYMYVCLTCVHLACVVVSNLCNQGSLWDDVHQPKSNRWDNFNWYFVFVLTLNICVRMLPWSVFKISFKICKSIQ